MMFGWWLSIVGAIRHDGVLWKNSQGRHVFLVRI